MVGAVIGLILSNFTVICLIVGLLCAVVDLMRRAGPHDVGAIAERLLAWFLFWSVGISLTYNFIMHCFFGEMTAGFIGWADSPFQFEVGVASLGMALAGFYTWRKGSAARMAALLGPAIFLWGAAWGHVVQMVKAHNFAPGNAGPIFYTDILVPMFGFVTWWLSRHIRR